MSRNLCYRLGALFLSFSLSMIISAQSAYERGWDNFLKNNREEARNYFNKASNDPKTKSDAFLSLALLDNSIGQEEKAFENWLKFYDGTEKADVLFYTSSHMSFAFSSRSVLKQNKLDFLQKQENSSTMNGYAKAIVAMNLGYHYFGLNDVSKAKEYFRSTGVLHDWQVLGAFDNTSGGGFNKNWGALAKVKRLINLQIRLEQKFIGIIREKIN